MRKTNLPLLMGIIFLSLLILMLAAPGLLSSSGPYSMQALRSSLQDGRLSFFRAPFAPDGSYPLGSDELGRDIWARIVYGARLTIPLALLIVLMRLMLALPAAVAAAFGNRPMKILIQRFSLIFKAIPPLLTAIFILNMEIFQSLPRNLSLLSFSLVLSILTWARLADLIHERSKSILMQQYISTERAVGFSSLHIARHNLMPHLMPELVIISFMEIASALSLLMQLGIFSVFVGNLRIVADTQNGIISYIPVSFEPEWAAMLGTARTMIYRAPWMVIYPALAFFLAVAGFNLTAEGLRIRFETRGLRLRRPGRRDLAAAGAGLLILAALLLSNPLAREQRADSRRLGLAFEAIPAPPASAAPGSREYVQQTRAIEEALAASGFAPLGRPGDEGYSLPFDPGPILLLDTAELVLRGAGGFLRLGEGDFTLTRAPRQALLSGPLFDGRREDLIRPRESGELASLIVLADAALYPPVLIDAVAQNIGGGPDSGGGMAADESTGAAIQPDGATGTAPAGAKGGTRGSAGAAAVLFTGGEPAAGSRLVPVGDYLEGRISGGRIGELNALLAEGPLQAEIAVKGSISDGGLVSIAGLLPGSDPDLDDNYILLLFSRRSLEGSQGLHEALALLRALGQAPDRRNIIAAFTDGAELEGGEGLRQLMSRIPYNYADIELCIDMTALGQRPAGPLLYSAVQAPVTRSYAWNLGKILRDELGRGFDDLTELPSVNRGGEYRFTHSGAANVMFWEHGIPSLRMESGPLSAEDFERLTAALLSAMRKNSL